MIRAILKDIVRQAVDHLARPRVRRACEALDRELGAALDRQEEQDQKIEELQQELTRTERAWAEQTEQHGRLLTQLDSQQERMKVVLDRWTQALGYPVDTELSVGQLELDTKTRVERDDRAQECNQLLRASWWRALGEEPRDDGLFDPLIEKTKDIVAERWRVVDEMRELRTQADQQAELARSLQRQLDSTFESDRLMFAAWRKALGQHAGKSIMTDELVLVTSDLVDELQKVKQQLVDQVHVIGERNAEIKRLTAILNFKPKAKTTRKKP